MELPICVKCGLGQMVPLSDTDKNGSVIEYKLWVCVNPDCGHFVVQRGGDPYYGECGK